jgi:AcrR family transcriptional regulator
MKQHQKSEATKTLILQSAIDLGKQVGFQATSIRGICKRAGISIGAFYHYFKSKEDLINEAFYQFDITLSGEIIKKYDAMPPLDALRAVLLDQMRFTVEQGYQLVTEYYRALLQSQNRGAVNPERRYYRAVRKCVVRIQKEGLFSAAISPTETSELFVRFVRGNLLDWCLHNGGYDVVAQTDKELDALMKASYFRK